MICDMRTLDDFTVGEDDAALYEFVDEVFVDACAGCVDPFEMFACFNEVVCDYFVENVAVEADECVGVFDFVWGAWFFCLLFFLKHPRGGGGGGRAGGGGRGTRPTTAREEEIIAIF